MNWKELKLKRSVVPQSALIELPVVQRMSASRRDAIDAFWRAFEAHDAMALNQTLDQLNQIADNDDDETESDEIQVDAIDPQSGLSALHRLVQSAHNADKSDDDASFHIALCVDTVVRRCHADVDVPVGPESAYAGFTPLLLAAHFDDASFHAASVFRALLRTGAALDARSPDGFTVAHVAAAALNSGVLAAIADAAASGSDAGATEVVRRRAAAAAATMLAPSDGGRAVTPLMLAAARGASRSIDVLLSGIARAHGPPLVQAAIAARDADGRTALHHAFQVPVQAILSDSYVVPLDCVDAALQIVLHSDGSLDVDAKDNDGVSAMDYAFDTLYAVLRACAANPRWFRDRNLTSLAAIAGDANYELAAAFDAELRVVVELERGVVGGCPVMNKNSTSRNYGKMRRGEIARPVVLPTQKAVAEATSDAAAKCPFVSKQRQALEAQKRESVVGGGEAATGEAKAKCPIPSPQLTMNVLSGVVMAVVLYGVVKRFLQK